MKTSRVTPHDTLFVVPLVFLRMQVAYTRTYRHHQDHATLNEHPIFNLDISHRVRTTKNSIYSWASCTYMLNKKGRASTQRMVSPYVIHEKKDVKT